MKILTFDTSLDKTYVTLSFDGVIIESETVENTEDKYHSAFLIPILAQILKKNNLQMPDIDAIGTNIGPGSFTGIRACLSVAKVIAAQLGVKTVGVSSLEILSKIADKHDFDDKKMPTLVVTDARKNMGYVAAYKGDKTLESPSVIDLDKILEMTKKEKYFIIADEIISAFLRENDIESLNFQDENYELGEFLSKIVYNKLNRCENGGSYTWEKLKPLYIQPPAISAPKVKSARG